LFFLYLLDSSSSISNITLQPNIFTSESQTLRVDKNIKLGHNPPSSRLIAPMGGPWVLLLFMHCVLKTTSTAPVLDNAGKIGNPIIPISL
jgi:hypothetical protein